VLEGVRDFTLFQNPRINGLIQTDNVIREIVLFLMINRINLSSACYLKTKQKNYKYPSELGKLIFIQTKIIKVNIKWKVANKQENKNDY
jgi:hypothetical protein